MEVFKFGGASVKDASSVKNVASILMASQRTRPLWVIISAMDKTTNALEKVVQARLENDVQRALVLLESTKSFHIEIAKELGIYQNSLADSLNNAILEAEWALEEEVSNPHYLYDQVVCVGELLSTHIISAYLTSLSFNHQWIDARSIILTNDRYKEGRVLWKETQEKIDHLILSNPDVSCFITQGFIGSTLQNTSTTLGREGSDFTAAILAYTTNAEKVSIWKDVPAVLNADPKLFEQTIPLHEISYEEAIELTYYGASVIHPRTIQPLKNKNIPLHVRSFIDLQSKGTLIHGKAKANTLVPCIIVKKNQTLISLSPLDFSFIAEDHLKDIFTLFSHEGIKINLMQVSAITFSACFDQDELKLQTIQKAFSSLFSIQLTETLELITIRHYNESVIEQITQGKKVILEQKSKETIRFVCS